MRARTVTGACVCALATAAQPARATPDNDLDRASQLFREHDWQSAIPLLGGVLYPQPLLGDPRRTFEAHVLLGACEYETGDLETARTEFDRALVLDPDRTLPPLSGFSPGVIEEYEKKKLEVHERLVAAEKRKAAAIIQDALNSRIFVEQHSRVLTFLPFGVGQFQNGDNKKFVLLGTTEFATFATSAVIWGYLVNTYGINGTVDPHKHNPETVRTLQQVEIGSGIGFVALYLYGVIDASIHYKPQITIDRSQLPPDLRNLNLDAPAQLPVAKPPKTSFHIGPIVVPGGAGVGLQWER